MNPLIIDKGDFAKGPLYGRTQYLVYSIYYNMPGLSARSGDRFGMEYHLNLNYTNDIDLYFKLNRAGTEYDTRVIRDYEAIQAELGLSFFITKFLQVGFDFTLNGYYGGFLDAVIQGYHQAFGFPNGGRELVPQNQMHIDIQNDNNVKLYLDRPAFSFGDTDLWCKYTFFERKWISLAGLGALKIPTGRLGGITVAGSGYPDMAFGLLADFRPVWILSFYLQSGLVVPFDSIIRYDSKPYPMFQGLAGIELNPLSFFSLIVQFNIKTSPLSGWYVEKGNEYYEHDYLSRPQINTLVGVVFKYKGFRWQFYVEEDSFTNAGVDITFNLSFSHYFRIKRR